MRRDKDLIKGANRNLELARKYRNRGDIAVATLLYNKAISGVMHALYVRKTGRSAPPDATVQYLSSKANLPDEVGEYIRSVMETESNEEEMESIELAETAGLKTEGRLLYLDGLIKRLLDYASAY
jgi:hypothetical protein